jgi:neutral ceramidase
MKMLRYFLRVLGVLVALVALVAAFSIRRLDDSPYQQNAFYRTMMARLDSLPNSLINPHTPFPTDTGEICVGWSKVNITPNYPVPTAGYGKRKGQTIGVVHDSLFVRAFVFEQKGVKSAVVSCDLLIIPPEVTLQLQRELPSINWSWQHVFIGATHTHNSMGAWGKRYIGELFAGKYDQRIVDLLSRSIVEAIQKAQQNLEPATIGSDRVNANEFVKNRLVDSAGTEDPWLRFLVFTKRSGKRASLVTFAAHSTTLSDSVMQLSRDYNGILVDKLERDNGLEQAVFMAGCVGSMGPEEPKTLNDWQQAAYLADGLEDKMDAAIATNIPWINTGLRIETIPLSLREPQWRIAENWCLRHWVWTWLYGDYDSEVKAMRLGGILMVGLPCDFSGELMQPLEDYAKSRGKILIITSFNGGYVGYITKDSHYNLNKYETRVMNWFGPNNGAYFSEIVKQLVDKM